MRRIMLTLSCIFNKCKILPKLLPRNADIPLSECLSRLNWLSYLILLFYGASFILRPKGKIMLFLHILIQLAICSNFVKTEVVDDKGEKVSFSNVSFSTLMGYFSFKCSYTRSFMANIIHNKEM